MSRAKDKYKDIIMRLLNICERTYFYNMRNNTPLVYDFIKQFPVSELLYFIELKRIKKDTMCIVNDSYTVNIYEEEKEKEEITINIFQNANLTILENETFQSIYQQKKYFYNVDLQNKKLIDERLQIDEKQKESSFENSKIIERKLLQKQRRLVKQYMELYFKYENGDENNKFIILKEMEKLFLKIIFDSPVFPMSNKFPFEYIAYQYCKDIPYVIDYLNRKNQTSKLGLYDSRNYIFFLEESKLLFLKILKKNLVKLTYCTEEEVFNICWKLLEEEWLLSTIDSQDEYEIQHLRKINKLEIFQSLTRVEININKLQPYYDYIKKECMTIVSTI